MTLDEMRELAVARLYESKHHEQHWDFLFETPGWRSVVYVPYACIECWEFEPEEWGWYEIPLARQDEILEGAEPTEAETKNWKIARSLEMIDRISSECSQAFIVPIWVQGIVQAYAVFDVGIIDGDPDSEPTLIDVFMAEREALAAVSNMGVTKSLI